MLTYSFFVVVLGAFFFVTQMLWYISIILKKYWFSQAPLAVSSQVTIIWLTKARALGPAKRLSNHTQSPIYLNNAYAYVWTWNCCIYFFLVFFTLYLKNKKTKKGGPGQDVGSPSSHIFKHHLPKHSVTKCKSWLEPERRILQPPIKHRCFFCTSCVKT